MGAMRLIAALVVLVLAGCSATPPTPRPPTSIPATATPRPPTATPAPDYRGMRNRLLEPLSAMVVATRERNTTNAATFFARFNQAGDDVLGAISNDMSKSANLLHSTVVSVRSHPSDVAALEEDRRNLITAIP